MRLKIFLHWLNIFPIFENWRLSNQRGTKKVLTHLIQDHQRILPVTEFICDLFTGIPLCFVWSPRSFFTNSSYNGDRFDFLHFRLLFPFQLCHPLPQTIISASIHIIFPWLMLINRSLTTFQFLMTLHMLRYMTSLLNFPLRAKIWNSNFKPFVRVKTKGLIRIPCMKHYLKRI